MKVRSLIKRFICLFYVVVFVSSYPIQVIAAEQELPESYEGRNDFDTTEDVPLTEEEFNELMSESNEEVGRDSISASLVETSNTDSVTAEDSFEGLNNEPADEYLQLTQECQLDYTVSRDGRKTFVEMISFKGTAEGGNIEKLQYRLSADQDFIDVEDYSRENIDKEEEDKKIFGDKITWNVSIDISSLEKSKVYQPEIRYVKKVAEEGQSPETFDFKTYSFALAELSSGQTLSDVSEAYSVKVSDLRNDNKLSRFWRPRKGSILFIKNPEIVETDTSDIWTDDFVTSLAVKGEIPGMEYANGFISLYDGELFYSDADFSFKEIDEVEIEKYFHSTFTNFRGLFGKNTTSLFDQRIVELDENKYLFLMDDGRGITFTQNADGKFTSVDGNFELQVSTDKDEFTTTAPEASTDNTDDLTPAMVESIYKVTDKARNYYTFDSDGKILTYGTKKGDIYTVQYSSKGELLGFVTRAGKRYLTKTNANGRIVEIKKPDNTVITYSYDTAGFLSSKTNEMGAVTSYAYDNARLSKVTNARNISIVSFTYNADGSVATYTNGVGDVSSFAYDKASSVTTFTDAKKQAFKYEYDSKGHHTKIIDPTGKYTAKNFDERGNTLSTTDQLGKTISYSYDVNNNLLEEKNSDGTTKIYTYDAKGNLLTEKDENKNVTTYEYDDKNNPVKITYPDKTVTTVKFDDQNRMISTTKADGSQNTYSYEGSSYNVAKLIDGNGNVTTNTYDACDRLLTTTSGSDTTTYKYTATGKILESIDSKNNKTAYEYDAEDNNTVVIDAKGCRVVMTYDGMNRVTDIAHPDGSHEKFEYDPNGNIIKEIGANGEIKTYTFDENDNVKSESSSGGQKISYERDSKGRVTKETDKDGATITYKYHDTHDLVIEKKDKLDRVTKYEYDKVGNLLKETRPDGKELVYTYDKNNRMLTKVDDKNVKTTYTYDSEGNILSEKQEAGKSTREKTYTYDKNGNTLTEKDYNGNITTFVYDSENRVMSIRDARGFAASYTYDGSGNVLTETDRAGAVKRYTYDSVGNMLTMTDGNGNLFRYEYDSEGRVVKEYKPDGKIIGAVFNDKGYLAQQIDIYGNKTFYEYDDNGNVIKTTDKNGNVSEYKYDADNNNTLVKAANGTEEKYYYNKAGWCTKVEENNGNYKIFSYDIMGNTVGVKYENGAEEKYVYDTRGNVIKEITKEGIVKTYTYDDFSNLTKVVSTDGSSISYIYDKNGNILSQELANGAKTSYEYDAAGNTTKVTASDGGVTTYEYNGNGALTKVTDCYGNITIMEYDPNGNLIKTTSPDGSVSTATYDFNGQLKTQTDKLGNTKRFRYDAMGNLLEESTAEGATFKYTYDKMGHQLSLTDGVGNVASYEYDAMGNMISQTSPTGAKTTYKYNKDNNIEEETSADGAVTKYKYDKAGNMTDITYDNGTEVHYEFDKAGRKISETSINGLKTTYVYNDMNLVSSVTETGRETGERVTTYSYDIYGRLIKEEATGYHPITYEYDSKDRVVKTTQKDKVSTVKYDFLDRQSSVTDFMGNVTSYKYDSNGNVIEETITPYDSSATRTTEYTYDFNGNLLSTKYANGDVVSVRYDRDGRKIAEIDAKGNETKYEYDKVGNVVAITDRLGHRSCYAYDGNGNVTAVTDVNEVVTKYGYDIMGRVNKVEDALGTTVYYKYDKSGNMFEEITTDKEDDLSLFTGKNTRKKVEYTYDKLGQLIEVGSPTGESEKYEYYKDGSLKKTISPSKKEISYEYDIAGNLIKVCHGKDVNAIRTYDGYGQLESLTDGEGVTNYTYDLAGRVTKVAKGNLVLNYSYDGWGNLVSLEYPDHKKDIYEYDSVDRIASMTERSGTKVEYTYDANSNIISEKRSDGLLKENTFDELDRIISTKTTKANKEIGSYKYQYDFAGRMTSEVVSDSLGTVTKNYSYNEAGKLISYEEFKGRELVNPAKSIQYSYDLYGNRKEETTVENGKTTTVKYNFDLSDRLKYKTVDGKTTGTYEYDDDGNLISKTEDNVKTDYTYTVDNRIATVTVNGVLKEAIKYDGNGLKSFEILRKEYTDNYSGTKLVDIDPEENEENLEQWVDYYQKDVNKRNTSTEEPTGDKYIPAQTNREYAGRDYQEDAFFAASVVGTVVPSLYDEWNDFASTFYEDLYDTIYTAASWLKGEDISDDSDEASRNYKSRTDKAFSSLIETEAEDDLGTKFALSSFSGSRTVAYYEPISYLYNLTVENPEVLAEYSSPNSSTSKNAYDYGATGRTVSDKTGVYVYDGRGSVSETVSGSRVTSTLRYDPYGNITTGAPVQEQVYAYNGEQYTPQTGLIYLRARNYDPATGTFTSKDTYMGDKTDLVTRNRYTYGNNNPVAFQDPSGHKGIIKSFAAAVKSKAKAVVKTVSKPVVNAAKAVTKVATKAVSTVTHVAKQATKAAASVASRAVSAVRSAPKAIANRVSTVYNAAKTYVSNATTAVVNKVTGAVNTVVNYAKSAAQTVYNAAVNTYNSTKALYQEAKETVVNYVDKAKTAVATFAHDAWEGTKDVIEEGLQAAITGRQLVAQGLQEAGEWWSNTSVSKNLTKAAEAASSAWHNSAIGKSVTAISQSIDKAATAAKEKFENSSIGQFCSKVANSVTSFYEKHKTAINIIVGVAVIALCAVATVATAGGCGIAFAMASGALKGALIGAATGAVGGGMKSTLDYYEEHGTIDGSGSQILSGAAQGFATGAAAGAASGAMAGAGSYAKHPEAYCFIAGTLVLTAVGLTNIENIQPGDLVYAKEAVGVEQSVDVSQDAELAPVLEIYAHEVDETYVVAVDGEVIETTANHPFYNEDGEQVEAQDLEEGDELTTEDGTTATVDSVECVHHDEPVMVYNFCVMEDHTYFVGEHGVLVHNHCNNPLAEKINHAKEKISGKFPGKANANVGNGKQYSVLFEGDTGSGLSRSAHRNHANKQFFNTMKENADFKNSVDDFFGYDVMEHMQSGKSALKNPATDWVWHHAADRPGVMQLIPKAQHQSPLLQNILHPGTHGRGGFGIYY